MVDAETGHSTRAYQLKNQRVNGIENLWQFNPDRRQIVHVEKTAIINLFGCDSPIGQPVRLRVEQLIKGVEAARVARLPIDLSQCLFDCLLYLWRFRATAFETSLDDFFLSNALRNAVRVGFSSLW